MELYKIILIIERPDWTLTTNFQYHTIQQNTDLWDKETNISSHNRDKALSSTILA